MNKPIDPKLAKFIAESKVKNRVYHGTDADIREFRSGNRNRIVKGIYFAENPETANIFAGKGTGANVMPAHLALKNPATQQDMERILDAMPFEKKRTSAQRTALLKKAGHDSAIINTGAEGTSGNNYYIAFHPTQIKSAIGNRGTYDPNDPDITKAGGGPVLPIGPPADVAAKLAALKEQMRQQGTNFDRRMQGVVNAEKTAGTGVVLPTDKAKGGPIHLAIGGQGPKNWIKGGVEQVLEPLKVNHRPNTPENEAELQAELQDATSRNDQRMLGAVQADMLGMKHGHAINQWVERNLANYIRKQMATHDDPIRKLAEQGIVHMPPERMGYGSTQAEGVRKVHGAPRLGQSEAAQAWEDAADVAMHPMPIKDLHRDYREPWMVDADPQTKIFTNTDNMHAHYLGFDHLVDILKQDLNEGRLRPEQLSKVSIEHAVRRAHEYDQERKKAMAETALKATEGMPVHKEYPKGYKWIELALDKNLPEGHKQTPAGTYIDPEGNESIHHPNYAKLDDALKYEGDTMGHCVGGYTPDVVSGKSRIFSLRDAKNEPHVTVEVKPSQHLDFNKWWDEQPKELRDEINDRARRGEHKGSIYEAPEYLSARAALPPSILQIKGKGNAKPKKDYIPFVQDFVKSGKWSDVDDLENAELIPLGNGKYADESETKKHFEPRIKNAVDFLQNHPAFKEQHVAKTKRNKGLLDLSFDDQNKLERVYGQPIYPKSAYSATELLNVIKNPEENISNRSEYYPSLNSWLGEAEKGMAHHGYKPDQKARGGIIHKAEGSNVQPSIASPKQPSVEQMQKELASKEDALRLYHGSPEENLSQVQDKGLFGGVFGHVDKNVAWSHGDHIYHSDIPKSKILTNHDLNYELPYKKVSKALINNLPHLARNKDLREKAWEAIVEDKGVLHLDEDDLQKIFGTSDLGDAGWEAQKVRGAIAKDLGYQAVEMEDEHGTSHLILPGAKLHKSSEEKANYD